MTDILTKILSAKKAEIQANLDKVKITDLEDSPFFYRIGKSLKKQLTQADNPRIITEFKRKSPSAGMINESVRIQEVIRGYAKAGAAGISVLTNHEFFGGQYEDLRYARNITELPILRKDFIIDEIQVYASKSLGADIILLIAEALTKPEVAKLAKKAKELNLEVLFEIHSEEQLDKLTDDIDIVGVNNRNLKTFDVNIQNSLNLVEKIPGQFAKISESGISHPDTVKQLYDAGFQGFLIGGHFMQHAQPYEAAKTFIEALQ